MLLKNLNQMKVPKVIGSWLIVCTMAGFCLLSSRRTVAAGSIMQAQGPCTFSEQLQKSVSVRKKYLVKLSSLVGETVPGVGAVEDMYSNIKSASYNPESAAEEDDNFFGVAKSVRKAPVELDSFSVDCLSCHDGAGAVSVSVDWRNNPAHLTALRRPSGSDHPIGMDYESYVAQGRDYKSVGGNTKMVFVNGKVGCLTCHNPLNPEKGHLVMSDRGSALCLSCHSR
jgi:predicted CXXCH cytochrome family protein